MSRACSSTEAAAPSNSVICIFTSIVGCFLVAAGMEGWVVRPLIKWKRILAVAGGLCCIIPEHITDLIGVAVLVFLVVSECRSKKTGTACRFIKKG